MYSKTNLPSKLLTPPIKSPDLRMRATWKRNWSLYAISRQWEGSRHGMLVTLAKWLTCVQPSEPQLSRQRIQSIILSLVVTLADYSDEELGIQSEPTS